MLNYLKITMKKKKKRKKIKKIGLAWALSLWAAIA